MNKTTKWDWRPITVGLINENYAEVVKGLAPGEKVIARPEDLPAPPVNPPSSGCELPSDVQTAAN